MAADHTQEIARLKEAIADMLKKVPPSVCAAGLKTTQAYKGAVDKAKKVMSSPRSTLASAQQAHTILSGFWRP